MQLRDYSFESLRNFLPIDFGRAKAIHPCTHFATILHVFVIASSFPLVCAERVMNASSDLT